MSDPLRAALAEALPDVHKPDWHPGMLWTDVYEQWADRILAHPAVLAALDRSDPTYGPNPCIECGKPAKAVVTVCEDHMVPALLDRSDPAVGLRNIVGTVIHEQLAGVVGSAERQQTVDALVDALAATPTASPTAPTHVHEWEAWDSTDPNESWFACVSGCSSIVRRRLASPTATGERE